ncbi:MAG: hypothetical protein ACFFCS_24695 [Candidatus Hodarchaeota archaeon]
MVNIFGFEIDIFSLISFFPAIFGMLIGIRNWLIMRKGANIIPNKIYTYGIISTGKIASLFFPLIFHNVGTKPGMIHNIKISFKDDEGSTKDLNIIDKVKLIEHGVSVRTMNYDIFMSKGFSVVHPLYPIVILDKESSDVIVFCVFKEEENTIPYDTDLKCTISILYGKNKKREVEFPFRLSREKYILTDHIRWFKPIE